MISLIRAHWVFPDREQWGYQRHIAGDTGKPLCQNNQGQITYRTASKWVAATGEPICPVCLKLWEKLKPLEKALGET